MIKDFFYYEPVKLLFGEGALNQTGEYASAYGKKALIITTGTFFKESGLVDRLQRILKKSKIDSVYFSAVDPNPLHTQIDAGAAVAKSEGCDMFIGLGGGSAIDAAKGMAVAFGHDRPIWDFCIGEDVQVISAKTMPIIAITTTSGTGSEATQWSVITNPSSEEKPGIGSDNTFAKVAIVDPELMASMPPKITASTGFDTLAHAIEAYTSTASTPITDMMCEKAIRLVGLYLRRAVKDGSDREARNGMAFANTLAGIGIANGVVTVCHGLAHSVGGVCGTTHGETLACMTPQTFRFSMRANPEKYKNIGMWLRNEYFNEGQDLLEDSLEEVEAVINDVGLNVGLRALGVDDKHLDKIANGVIGYMGGSIEIDPMNPTKEDLIQILKESM
ncbi:iron-containing alcohol dehydrogenase [Oceanispirochaeta sp.]|jgi:alcohol dehydrogenase|uniref:iron-containing alcohol dehydrogenase n=1 Tax=Oceanispirochaeta sp. TaxID=2035350 RepID=UPI002603BC91|nr:iron-containing alcohol dehydrogenase [Oceanispirochaeta sp.]MDA3958416.1 iron-containing alcohol dehydrogenase [Oceanispirochaeta sp.]